MPLLIKPGNLKSRIAVIVAVLVFLAVGLVTATSLLLARSETGAILGSEQYSTLIGTGAYIDRDLDSKKALLRLLAEDVPETALLDLEQVQRFIERHTTLREEFANVVAFDAAGNLVASLSPRKAGDPVNFKERDYFRDTVAYKEGVVSAPFLSKLTRRPVVMITQPITDQAGRLKFIIGGTLDLSSPRIFGQLEAVKPGKTGYAFLLAGDGTLILHPDKTRILANVMQEPGGPTRATAAALRGFEGWTEDVSKAGAPALLTYRRLRTNNWIVGTVYPSAEAFAPFERARAKALATALAVAALAGLIGWLGISRLLRPLGVLQRQVAGVSDGGGDLEVFNVQRDDEFGRLSRAFYALSKKRAAAEAALAAQALTDPLTGLSNRRMFDSAIALAFARAQRSQGMLAVAYLDIDHFKSVNDSLGHGAGDLVLVEFARRLRGAVRVTDTVVRIAGDEFMVIFENFTDHCHPHALGQKIIDAMAEPMRIEDQSLQVGTSVGICVGVTEGLTVHDFIRLADAALYRSKQNGRGRYSVHAVAPADLINGAAVRAAP
ncbi:MAG: sensor diguanylate cyclase [Massilia sp.]|nr:sensor diguanylate cyclase [Massilia sp.]